MTETETKYKVLTLWQPWASLLAYGYKRNETRPGETRWKGVYLIHAAQRLDQFQLDIMFKDPFREALMDIYGVARISDLINLMPFGKIIGAFEVDFCHKIPELIRSKWTDGSEWKVKTDPVFDYTISSKEFAFGDYTPGRYIWFGKHHRILKNPIPYTGGQGYYQNFKGDVNQLIFK